MPIGNLSLKQILSYNFAFLNTLRLFRLTRILKIGRYSESVRSLFKVIISKKGELLITFSIVFFLLIIASSLMFFVEHQAQPETFSSIPASMWWGVVTLTTVGYGDIYPVTIVGKCLGAMLAFLGIGVFVLPAGIIASGFAAMVTCDLPNDSQTISPATKKQATSERYEQIKEDARLLKHCLQIAKEELSTVESSEGAIHSLAMFLYCQARQRN